jgi:copper chaperone
MERRTVNATGMSCPGCEQNVESALRNVEGVNRVEADHEGETVEVVVEVVVEDDVAAAIEDAGYEVPA